MNYNVVYIYEDDMWELHVEVTLNGETGYVKHMRCSDDDYHPVMTNKVRKLIDGKQNYRLYLGDELIYQSEND